MCGEMYSAALYYCPKRNKCFCLSDGHMTKEGLIGAWKDRPWIYTNGLLEPSGKFHPCFYAQHIELVSYLFPSKEVDDWEPLVSRRNWLHLSDGSWSWCNKVSRKQMDIIEDFAAKHECQLPSWWKEREDYII